MVSPTRTGIFNGFSCQQERDNLFALLISCFSRAAERVAEIQQEFPGLVRELPQKPKCYTLTWFDKEELIAQILELQTEIEDKLHPHDVGPQTGDRLLSKIQYLGVRYHPQQHTGRTLLQASGVDLVTCSVLLYAALYITYIVILFFC